MLPAFGALTADKSAQEIGPRSREQRASSPDVGTEWALRKQGFTLVDRGEPFVPQRLSRIGQNAEPLRESHGDSELRIVAIGARRLCSRRASGKSRQHLTIRLHRVIPHADQRYPSTPATNPTHTSFDSPHAPRITRSNPFTPCDRSGPCRSTQPSRLRPAMHHLAAHEVQCMRRFTRDIQFSTH